MESGVDRDRFEAIGVFVLVLMMPHLAYAGLVSNQVYYKWGTAGLVIYIIGRLVYRYSRD